jgi:NADH-quinone oxidoreductase subunit G
MAPDIKEELPVLYLRLRHAAVEKGVRIIEISPGPTGLSARAAQSLHYRPGDLSALVRALTGRAPITQAVAGIPAEQAEQARAAIYSVPRLAVVLGRASVAEPATGTAEAAELLSRLPGVSFLPALRRSNVHGAIDLGLSPGLLPGRVGLDQGRQWYERHWGAPLPAAAGLDALGILARAAAGQLDVLFLLGADPLSDCPDRDLAARALAGARFVVAIDAFRTASVAHADVVLPAAVYTERRGSFTPARTG